MNLLLFDIGNTHTHLGLANERRVVRHANFPTTGWRDGSARNACAFVGSAALPAPLVQRCAESHAARPANRPPDLENRVPLTPRTIRGVGINYQARHHRPRPPANAVAVHHHYGAPAVVDFGRP
jgi:hypothetical protein